MAIQLQKDHEEFPAIKTEENNDVVKIDIERIRQRLGKSGIARKTPISTKKFTKNKTALAPNIEIKKVPAILPLDHSNDKENTKSRSLSKLSTKPCCLYSLHNSYLSVIHANISSKFVTTRTIYNSKVINDIMNDEPTHIVSVFKEYLIQDDATEFCREYYKLKESKKCLKSITLYHSKYSQVFPNYFRLDLKRSMFRNIRRKQKVIDRLNMPNESSEEGTILNTDFMKELNKTDSVLGKSLREVGKDLQELVDKVMAEDSWSFMEGMNKAKVNNENDSLSMNKGRNYNRLHSKKLKPKTQTEVEKKVSANRKSNTKKDKMQILIDSILKGDQKSGTNKKSVNQILDCNRSKSTDKFILSPRLQLIQTTRESTAHKLPFSKKTNLQKPTELQAMAQLFNKTKYLVHLERSKNGHSKPRQHTTSLPKKLEQQNKVKENNNEVKGGEMNKRNHNYSK